MYKVYSGKYLFWHHCLQQFFFYKTVSRNSFNLFRLGGRRLLSDFTRKCSWFHRHAVRFLKNLGSRLKFEKTEPRFCRWKRNDCGNINYFLSLENPCIFLLATEKTWKSIYKVNCELSPNHTEKNLHLPKLQ